jgi:hypothetical protein
MPGITCDSLFPQAHYHHIQMPERVGDMGTLIGEQITFFVDAVNVKHKFVQIDGEN